VAVNPGGPDPYVGRPFRAAALLSTLTATPCSGATIRVVDGERAAAIFPFDPRRQPVVSLPLVDDALQVIGVAWIEEDELGGVLRRQLEVDRRPPARLRDVEDAVG